MDRNEGLNVISTAGRFSFQILNDVRISKIEVPAEQKCWFARDQHPNLRLTLVVASVFMSISSVAKE